METSEFHAAVHRIHTDAEARGLYFQTAGDTVISGREVQVQGKDVVSFSSCSYLGLEHHPALVAGVHAAVERYGTQFSSSRGYLSAPAYTELEALLSEVFDGHAMVTSSTSLGHQSSLPVLVTEKDGLVMDHQVHHSVQIAAQLARAGGAQVALARHAEPERALAEVRRLAARCRTVWYATDGVFSMYGDLPPLELLREILDVGDNVYLYVDDAHGMSWAGRHGRGSFLSRMPMHDRLVLATSLNKAFSAAGGCLVFPSQEMKARVRRSGGAHVFSGPVQPPMLGAAVASARLHLSPEITGLQEALKTRMELVNDRLLGHGLPLLAHNESPIFFLRTGLAKVAFQAAQRMLDRGWYINPSVYPSVPLKRAGLRFSITAAHTVEDLTGAIDELAEILPACLEEEGVTAEDLDLIFQGAVPVPARMRLYESSERVPRRTGTFPLTLDRPTPNVPAPEGLRVERCGSIRHLDRDEWDRMLGEVGSCSYDALLLAEGVFRGHAQPEYNWDFEYVVVRHEDGSPAAATFFTVMLNKDDMLMRHEVSAAVEARRVVDRYFLTSKIVTMGSGFSEGNHLFLDRSRPWRAALDLLLSAAEQLYESTQAAALILRDIPTPDPELDEFIHERGFVAVPMFDSHRLAVPGADEEAWLAQLSRRKRKHLREIIKRAANVRREVYSADSGRALDPELARRLYGMYREVAERNLRLNVFPLPTTLIAALASSPAWEVVAVYLAEEAGGPADGQPIAWYGAHRFGGHYAPFLCGLDYDYVFEHGAYRSMVYEMIDRARELGMKDIHMGMDAELEKARFGAVAHPNCVYLRARDHFNGRVLQEMVAEVGLEQVLA